MSNIAAPAVVVPELRGVLRFAATALLSTSMSAAAQAPLPTPNITLDRGGGVSSVTIASDGNYVQVLTDNDRMIAGFVIYGDAPRTVVINVAGPSLAKPRCGEPARESDTHAGALVRQCNHRFERQLAAGDERSGDRGERIPVFSAQ